MLSITIGEEKTIVENSNTYDRYTLKTTNFFGDVYTKLEEHFPHFKSEDLPYKIIEHVRNKIAGRQVNDVHIFGCIEIGTSLNDLINFINNKEVLSPTIKDIERMRIEQSMGTTYLPSGITEDSIRFEGLQNVSQVMVAALYYYAFNEYKIIRCKHCGKWFATKTLKEQYCKRESPCLGTIIKGKAPIPCEQAVQNIRQKQRRRYNNIYHYLYSYAKEQREIDYFVTQAQIFKDEIKNNPSPHNFQAYETFLDRYPKRIKKEME